MDRHRDVVADAGWRESVRFALGSLLFTGVLLLLADVVAGGVTAERAVMTAGICCAVGLMLWPHRIRGGSGWLEARWLWSVRRVRTDRLVLVRRLPGRVERMVLRDTDGRSVELDADALVRTPALWLLLDLGIEASRRAGWLRAGRVDAGLLDRIGARAAQCTLLGVVPDPPRLDAEDS